MQRENRGTNDPRLTTKIMGFTDFTKLAVLFVVYLYDGQLTDGSARNATSCLSCKRVSDAKIYPY